MKKGLISAEDAVRIIRRKRDGPGVFTVPVKHFEVFMP